MQQFEVGDWVVVCNGGIYSRYIYQIEKIIPSIKNCSSLYSLKDFSKFLESRHIKQWTPQSEEWCWNPIFGLVKVLCETKTKGHFICWNPWRKEEQTLRITEPFIGELPQFNVISDEKTITRVEIINENGRAFVDTKSTYTLSFQDNNQTLKLFKQETK